MITNETDSNNELINYNLNNFLEPRQLACKQFNDKFQTWGTENEISVKLNSDLHNIIKENESVVVKYNGNFKDSIENGGDSND